MMKRYIIFFTVLSFSFVLYASGMEKDTADPVKRLMSVTSDDPRKLTEEAGMLGIPASEVKRYVAEMRKINLDYNSGSLTRTEYIRIKRDLIEKLKI